jgi:hypothetical protein
MAITTLDGLIAAVKQRVIMQKTSSRTSVAAIPFSVFDLSGNPGAGTLSAGNTANGVVPTNATNGYPKLPTPAGDLYLSRAEARSPVACWLDVYDALFACGAYAFNADTTLDSQPSYSGRLPVGGDYTGLELWIETVTAFTNNPSFQVNYLDQDGDAGDTGAVASGAALTLGRMFHMPLAAGDSGIQQITRVRGTVATAGTFNVLVLRHLCGFRINGANQGEVQDFGRLGLPKIFGGSALRLVVTADGTSTSTPSLRLEVADG